ncbi:M20 family metallopeptidase [Rubrobacter calidifluminis]|uniref:M20 family metallopeptidase n=1 Tax=Rubrobacter calidifluminis TaxID=1392640 RepID=UPI00235ED71D|nr:M20 family metallopeptidase [Rubrobacter calidifluminis]
MSVTGLRGAILEAVEELSPRMVDVLREFVRIPTVNPPGEHYEKFVGYMGDLLDGLGYEVEVLRVPEERLPELAPHGGGRPRPNLVARLPGDREGGSIHLNGHYDVVPAGSDWRHDPFGGELEDGRVYGRGAADQKSGLACQIFAVEALRRAGLDVGGRIVQSAVPDEETVGNRNAGMGFLVERGVIGAEDTDAVIITEPFGPEGIGLGHKGAIWCEITFFGRKAHGSAPMLGLNAVELAARFVSRVEEDLKPRLSQRRSSLAVTPAEAVCATLSFDTVQGGTATNTVPDRCRLTFNRRLVPQERLEEAREEILSLLEAFAGETGIRYDYRETYATEPVIIPEDEPLVRVARQAVRSLGMEPRLLISAGSDDQRFVVHGAGIENCIVYGPGRTALSHIADEYVEVEDLVAATKVLALILCGYLEAGEGDDHAG